MSFGKGQLIKTLPAGIGSISVAVDPTGRFAYVANRNSNNISGYTIDSITGGLTLMKDSPFAAKGGPASITTTSGPFF